MLQMAILPSLWLSNIPACVRVCVCVCVYLLFVDFLMIAILTNVR